MDVLVFELAGERCGLPVADVHEIHHAVAVARIPDVPEAVLGVVDVRGTLLPVIDLRRRFGLPRRPIAPADHFIRARAAERVVLLHVDRADRVEHVDDGALTRTTALTRGGEVVAGVAQTAEGLVLIHDLRALLSQAEADALDAAMRGAEALREARG